MIYVKICGITNLEDAHVAAEAGSDFLGFIFYPPSPRYITPEQAGNIIQAVRAEFEDASPRCVGVFVDEPVDAVRTVIETAGLDLAQLHGAETPAEVAALAPYAFKALRPQTLAEAQAALEVYFPQRIERIQTEISSVQFVKSVENIPQLLVDAYHPQQKGGTGLAVDVTIARWLAERCPLLLAGGLTPENVAEAIEQVHPWGVDVSSGIEVAKGKKDHAKVRRFISTAKQETHFRSERN